MQNTIFRAGLLSSFLFAATFSSAQTWVNVGNPVSGSINALSSFGGTLYLGGNFQRLNGGESDFTALSNGTDVTAHLQPTITGASGISSFYVNTVGTPALFAMGDQLVGTGAAAPAYCTKWITSTGWGDATFRTPAQATCLAAGYSTTGATLQFVGGSFNTSTLKYVARRSGTTWIAAGTGFNGAVRCLEIYNGEVYAGGDFTQAGTVSAMHLAKWDNTNAQWVAVGTGCNGTVRTLKSYNGALYIGGDFTSVSGLANSRLIVKYTASGTSAAFTALGGGITTGTSVRVIQSMNGSVFVGGDFTKAGTVSVKNLAVITAAAPYWQNYGSGITDPVNALIYHNANYYMGQQATGTATNYLKKWSVTTATQTLPQAVAIAAFPNPTTNDVTIETADDISLVQLYNLSGALVAAEGNINTNRHTVSIENLPQGTYILQVTTRKGDRGVQKIVKL